jgi:clan AA aspartic protease (TIGR02281 family)
VARRHCLAALLGGLLFVATAVQSRSDSDPSLKGLGRFQDWSAASQTASLETKCYASTTALSSSPVVPGRSAAVLWVTKLRAGQISVMIDAGFAVPDAAVTLQIGQTELKFYTITRQAFPRNLEATMIALIGSVEPRIVARFPAPNGTVITDTFSLNGFAAAYDAIREACPAAQTTAVNTTTITERPSGNMHEIPLREMHGILVVPVLVNDSMTVPFMIDSGAATVCIPADVAAELEQNGALWPNDYHEKRIFSMANGSRSEGVMIHIKSLQVGDRRVENISGVVTPARSPLLLGQSFLSRFKTWSIDNERKLLVLE